MSGKESPFKKEIMAELKRIGALGLRVEAGMGGTPGIPDIYAAVLGSKGGVDCWLEAKEGYDLTDSLMGTLNPYQRIIIPKMWDAGIVVLIACKTDDKMGLRCSRTQQVVKPYDVRLLVRIMLGIV